MAGLFAMFKAEEDWTRAEERRRGILVSGEEDNHHQIDKTGIYEPP
jgi:hypothetical protein